MRLIYKSFSYGCFVVGRLHSCLARVPLRVLRNSCIWPLSSQNVLIPINGCAQACGDTVVASYATSSFASGGRGATH